ncbi:MAG: thioredoxin domain-containing protein [Phycisphaerales bacterium]
MRNVFCIVVVMVLCMLTGVSRAADPTLVGAQLGKYVFGPQLTPDDLQGRVVLCGYFAAQDQPDRLAFLAELAKCRKKYPRELFTVIAINGTEADPLGIGAAWVNYARDDSVPVVDRFLMPGIPNNLPLPHCYLFDAAGKVVASGAPNAVLAKVDQTVQANPGFLLSGHDLKAMKREATTLGSFSGNMTGMLKRVRAAAAAERQPQHDEARLLLDCLNAWSQKQLEIAAKATAEEAINTNERVRHMVTLLKGDELGAPWIELEGKLKADKTFQEELKAAEFLMKIRVQAYNCPSFVLPPGVSKLPDTPSPDKVNIRHLLEQLSKKYPDTMAGRQATIYTSAWKL